MDFVYFRAGYCQPPFELGGIKPSKVRPSDLSRLEPELVSWLIHQSHQENRSQAYKQIMRGWLGQFPYCSKLLEDQNHAARILERSKIKLVEQGRTIFGQKKSYRQRNCKVLLLGRAVNLLSKSVEWQSSSTQRDFIVLNFNKYLKQASQPSLQQSNEKYLQCQPYQLLFEPFLTLTASLVVTVPFPQDLVKLQPWMKKCSLRVLGYSPSLTTSIDTLRFKRNQVFMGVFYLLQGQVQVQSRVLGRGWLVRGKSKSQGRLLSFNANKFYNILLNYQDLWHQFWNTLQLNGDLPLTFPLSKPSSLRRHSELTEQARYFLPEIKLSWQQRRDVERLKHKSRQVQRWSVRKAQRVQQQEWLLNSLRH